METDHHQAFGPFRIDIARGLLLRNGAAQPLGQRGMALLRALIAAEGQAVAKADLMEAGWPGLAVEEGNLTVQIAALRKALGPGPGGADWIVTVPRVGYRLVRAAPGNATGLPPVSDLPLIAVLPFSNISDDPRQDYFADGVVEDITIALSKFRSFAVIARHSSAVFKGRPVEMAQVADQLGVRYALLGSVRRAADRLRITAQLADCATGETLWAESFDGSVDGLFDFQDRITERVATLVEPRIQVAEIARARRERPSSVASHDIYLQALACILSETEAGNVAAHGLLTGALAAEPDNALLLTHAAWVYEHRLTVGWPPFGPDDRAKCADLARRGLEHAAGDATLMATCGIALLQGAKDYDWGMAAVRAALEANPNNLTVVMRAGVGNLHCGDVDTALACFRRAIQLSPGDLGSHIPLCGMAHVHMIRGTYNDALDWAARSLSANPNFNAALWMLTAANAHLGRMAEARHFLAQLHLLAPGVTLAKLRTGQPDRFADRMQAVFDGLRLAGMPEA